MSSRFVLTLDARDDLGAIVEYVRLDSPANAVRLIDEFDSTLRLITRRPRIGHRRTDLADEALRVFPLHSFVIIYRPESKPLHIIRILHGARDLRALLANPE